MLEKEIFGIYQLNREEVILHHKVVLDYNGMEIPLTEDKTQFLNDETGQRSLTLALTGKDETLLKTIFTLWEVEVPEIKPEPK